MDAQQAVQSWATTLMPLLYGGIMAAVAYFLFMSGILAGSDGQGLLTTNLFPTFKTLAESGEQLRVRDWLMLGPDGLHNVGKLMIGGVLREPGDGCAGPAAAEHERGVGVG